MSENSANHSKSIIRIGVVSFLIIAVILIGLKYSRRQKVENHIPKGQLTKIKPIDSPKAIMDYNSLGQDEALSALMEERKEKYGVDNGVDMIVKSDERLKVGDKTVSMEEIMDETSIQRGEIVEKDMDTPLASSKKKLEDFGIHVVRPGENIWNIHFALLQNYFGNKQISVSPLADEPEQSGRSSGVGKLLKFSERMVYIYNLEEQKLATDINLIEPLSKIVVYNMGEVFSLIDQIDYKNVDHIRFDGENIWLTNN